MAAPMIFVSLIGVTVRSVLFYSFVSSWLTDRVEISTPLTSWKSMVEGVTLLEWGISPYAGDIFHETPLLLYTFYSVHAVCPTLVPVIFVMLDLITALVLRKVATRTMKYLYNQQKQKEKNYASGVSPLLIVSSDLISIPDLVMTIYLFCPYTIVTCVAQCTIVFTNLAIAATFLFTLQGNAVAATLCLAFASYQSLYPVTLIIPVAMHIAIIKLQASKDKTISYQRPEAVHSILLTTTIFVFWLACFLGLSFLMLDSWSFLRSSYGFILAVPDLKPNMGLFWYFFTEMFEHFRTFFLWVFQINVFIYIAPLAIKMREHPLFVMLVQCIVITIFKSYPSVGDTTVYLSLLPVWSHTFHYFRNTLVVGVMMLLASVLCPVIWHLWIYAGSANANFFFAFTLIYNTAQIFLVTDLVFAFLRREFALKHGMEPLDEDGNKRSVRLQ
ncbi:phosphatidylinositol glycan anchor biosynthesis class U protein-like [Lytechinus variegatus]|uniref:phosphatidylinositol glycan anchor biosynthesis class U protein-like n=1 Tax=Lytechinus variegatus TaxID=7654 RepID=UPI001BB2C320|nr:phosphatidylinositol glycan anchor biosynthesis class U protein-like [Lytechinus variegatus]